MSDVTNGSMETKNNKKPSRVQRVKWNEFSKHEKQFIFTITILMLIIGTIIGYAISNGINQESSVTFDELKVTRNGKTISVYSPSTSTPTIRIELFNKDGNSIDNRVIQFKGNIGKHTITYDVGEKPHSVKIITTTFSSSIEGQVRTFR